MFFRRSKFHLGQRGTQRCRWPGWNPALHAYTALCFFGRSSSISTSAVPNDAAGRDGTRPSMYRAVFFGRSSSISASVVPDDATGRDRFKLSTTACRLSDTALTHRVRRKNPATISHFSAPRNPTSFTPVGHPRQIIIRLGTILRSQPPLISCLFKRHQGSSKIHLT